MQNSSKQYNARSLGVCIVFLQEKDYVTYYVNLSFSYLFLIL